MDTVFLSAAMLFASAMPSQPISGPIAPSRVIERSLVQMAQESTRARTSPRPQRRAATQPPLRMPATRATRGGLVLLGIFAGMVGGALLAEEMAENAWGYGFWVGGAAGGLAVFFGTQ